MLFHYQGITTLITGSSSGIGECFARELASRGSHVILTARSKDKLETLAAALRHDFKIQANVFAADLSETQGPQKLFDEIRGAGLSVDLLINNAGFGSLGLFEKSSFASNQDMIQVNVSSLTALTHLFLPGMFERAPEKRGQVAATGTLFSGGVINVASTASFQPLPRLALYAATKAFVLSFTEALWAEYKNHGVKFFCLCPGNTASNFHDKAGMDKRYRFLQAKTEDLVRFGLDTFAFTHRITAVHGFLNQILALGYRFAPRKLVVLIASLLYR
ncbi:MAG: SDR family oxidoreductase [Candidatus Omnitrophica bacterium]|nr:SDR family oxidoreductase [Candidatus Omnitrophota bacterium]